MVNLDDFYNNVSINIDLNHPLGHRLKPILDEVVQKLPNEEQFQMKGQIRFMTRNQAVEFWKTLKQKTGYAPDMRPDNRDGNCTYLVAENVKDSGFIITVIVDNLNECSDDYVKGLIAHEISEMSYVWKAIQNTKINLQNLKPKARQVKLNQITHHNAEVGSIEHKQHEKNVDNEAIRLGFAREILALNRRS